MRILVITLAAALLSGTGPVETSPDEPTGCISLAPEQIGQLPLTVNGVTFQEWSAKEVDGNELVGFRSTGVARIEVTAGDETWLATRGVWQQPHGVVGPKAAAISAIRICAGSEQIAQR